MEEQQLVQRAIAMNAEERKQRQIKILRERAAQRKEARMKRLKEKHRQEKDNLVQQLEKQMAEGDLTLVSKSKKVMEMEEKQDKEIEVLAKQIDSSNAQQEQKLNEALNQQQIEEIKESHKEAMKKLLSASKLDPSQQDAAMQELTESMKRMEDQVWEQRGQKVDEVKVCQNSVCTHSHSITHSFNVRSTVPVQIFEGCIFNGCHKFSIFTSSFLRITGLIL